MRVLHVLRIKQPRLSDTKFTEHTNKKTRNAARARAHATRLLVQHNSLALISVVS